MARASRSNSPAKHRREPPRRFQARDDIPQPGGSPATLALRELFQLVEERPRSARDITEQAHLLPLFVQDDNRGEPTDLVALRQFLVLFSHFGAQWLGPRKI